MKRHFWYRKDIKEQLMNVLIVFAHENSQSFNGAMKDTAVEVLADQGHSVQVSDLYAQGFNPVGGKHDFTQLSEEEFYKYQSEQVAATQSGTFATDVKAEMDKLDWADLVIFQHPLWWFDAPAILKGWYDRVLASGFAYGGGNMFDKGNLAGKRALVSITTGGPEQSYPNLNETLKATLFGRLYFCGMQVFQPFAAFGIAHQDDESRARVLADYRKRIEGLLEEEPIQYPTMAEMGMGQ